jgi:hypothetical protein
MVAVVMVVLLVLVDETVLVAVVVRTPMQTYPWFGLDTALSELESPK